MMRCTLTLVLPLLALATAAGAQTGDLTAATATRLVVKTERIPVKVADGRAGWVEFDITGEVGGSGGGRFRLSLGDGQAPATLTEYALLLVTVKASETDYEFLMSGAARTAASRATRQFTSQLKLAKASRVVYNPTELTVRKTNTGDIWVIDGLTCEWDGKDLICT